jgi:hypothetical protein
MSEAARMTGKTQVSESARARDSTAGGHQAGRRRRRAAHNPEAAGSSCPATRKLQVRGLIPGAAIRP